LPPSFLRLLTGLVAVALLAPAAVGAHSLFGNHDPNRPLIDYLTLGFGHMVGGWDHLLFIGAVGCWPAAGDGPRSSSRRSWRVTP
jgi:hydrogenase/urease accessory protein HupE